LVYAVTFATTVDVDRDLPLTYVALAQRLVALGAVLVVWRGGGALLRRPRSLPETL